MLNCNGVLEFACLEILSDFDNVCAIHQYKEIKMTFSDLQMHSSLEKYLDSSYTLQMTQSRSVF